MNKTYNYVGVRYPFHRTEYDVRVFETKDDIAQFVMKNDVSGWCFYELKAVAVYKEVQVGFA